MLISELRRAGVQAEVKVVRTKAAYLKNLDSAFDAIISDFDLPQFNAKEALALLQAQQLDIPFIVVSGTIGEETAVDLMKLGAADYLLKDRLARLPQALAHAVAARLLRVERLAVQQQLLLQSTAVETADSAVLVTNRSGAILWVNPAFTALTGYTAEEVLGKTPRVLKSSKHDQTFYRKLWKTILSGQTWRGEFTNRRKDGSLFYDEHTITPVRSEGVEITHFIGIMHDVT
ncbi:MAG TPA: PAS domain-containing protein, partial [Chthoniobacterales bacterium]